MFWLSYFFPNKISIMPVHKTDIKIALHLVTSIQEFTYGIPSATQTTSNNLLNIYLFTHHLKIRRENKRSNSRGHMTVHRSNTVTQKKYHAYMLSQE